MAATFVVTGGAGFIGSNLVRALNERGETDILVVDHLNHPDKHRNLERLSYREFSSKEEFRARLKKGSLPQVSCVFHLGACSSTTEMNEAYINDNNYLYTRELCEWALWTGTRFVYASSAATYGDGSLGYSDSDGVTPLLEPLNPYGRSKQMFDRWALETGALKKIAGIKYFNVYGPWEDHKGDMRSVVHKAYGQLMREGRITLFRSYRPEYRNGEQERDFIHVSDAVAVTLFFYDHPEACGLFNCGTGRERTWMDLASAVFAAAGVPPRIGFIDMPEAIRGKYQYHTCADLAKLRAAGFRASFLSVEEGVRRYVREYLAQEAYKTEAGTRRPESG